MNDRTLAEREKGCYNFKMSRNATYLLSRQACKEADILNVHAYFLTTKVDDALDYFNKL